MTVTVEESKRIVNQFLDSPKMFAVLINKYGFEDLHVEVLEYIIEQTLEKYPQFINMLCNKEEVVNQYLNLNIDNRYKDKLTEYLVTNKLLQ